MNRDQAYAILAEWTRGEPLLRHARSVEAVMRALARRFAAGPDPALAAEATATGEELFGCAGLLHDADYEAFPERHPQVTVERLRVLGEHALADAVQAHYSKWGHPQQTLLARALLAADELTGFVTACSLVHPEGIGGLTTTSVLKKFRQKSFAAKVERDEMVIGAERLGVPIEELTDLVIEVLREHRADLGLR